MDLNKKVSENTISEETATDEHDWLEENEEPLSSVTHFKIFWYVPNVVDYFRYVLSLQAIYYAFEYDKWALFVLYYYVAIALDVIDGAIARILNQTSRFGQCLDMVCDRASVSMMYIILGQVYPRLQALLILFFIIDYGSHFL